MNTQPSYQFEPFGKIPRLSREIVVTEKIDGTNGQIHIVSAYDVNFGLLNTFTEGGKAALPPETLGFVTTKDGEFAVLAGSRNRYITQEDDNHGFAGWVWENAQKLVEGLGVGRHFGEWWGGGIQRRYGVEEKKFSLFNTHRWRSALSRPLCCDVVPVLYQGEFSEGHINACLFDLKTNGSRVAPGCMKPEGIIIYHTASKQMFKKTLEKDHEHKGKSEETRPEQIAG